MLSIYDFYDKDIKFLDISKLSKFKKFIMKTKSVDLEGLHIVEDNFHSQFINSIIANKFFKKEIKDIAKELKEIELIIDKIGRWYA
jgi:hypothetical protein